MTSKSGMRMVDRHGKKGFLELDEPAWAPDDNFRACVGCNTMFGLFNRKHHCRRCGGVFCGDCATEKVIPMRLRFIDPVRMCGKCQKVARWENDYFNNYQMKLKTGEQLIVETETGGRNEGTVSLGGDGGLLQITSDTNPVVPILMDEVRLLHCFIVTFLNSSNAVTYIYTLLHRLGLILLKYRCYKRSSYEILQLLRFYMYKSIYDKFNLNLLKAKFLSSCIRVTHITCIKSSLAEFTLHK